MSSNISNSSLWSQGRRLQRKVVAFGRKCWQRLLATRVAEVTVWAAGAPGPGWRGRRRRRGPQDHCRPGQDLLLLPPDVVRRVGGWHSVSRGHRAPAALLILLGGTLGVVHDRSSFSPPPLHHLCGHTTLFNSSSLWFCIHVVIADRSERQTPLIVSAEGSCLHPSPADGRLSPAAGQAAAIW